jgi:hypothetical protein
MRADQRRGFRRERHTAFKLTVSLAAFSGFAMAWAGLARAHEDSQPAPAPQPSASTSDVSSGPATTATPAARPRMSRGS